MGVATVQGKWGDAGVMLALKPLIGSTLGLGRVHAVAISALALLNAHTHTLNLHSAVILVP